MLTTVRTLPVRRYIRRVQSGFLSQAPALRFCEVEFDRGLFSENDFDHFGLSCPYQLSGVAIKRQAEYLAGRYCASVLLAEVGCRSVELPFGREAPLWPYGWRGSISHTDHRAIAILAPVSSGLSPGVDIEIVRPGVMLETAEMFSTAAERAVLQASSLSGEHGLLALFSAKESFYKSLWPEIRRFLDFDVARLVAVDPVHSSLTLALTEDFTSTLQNGARFTAFYRLEKFCITTCIY